MKRVIILSALAALFTIVHAQDKTFAQQYLKNRQTVEKGGDVILKKLTKKDIRKMNAEFESKEHSPEEWESHRKSKAFFAKADHIMVMMDISDDQIPYSEMKHFLGSYEELASMQMDEINMIISGIPKGDKYKELLFLARMDDDVTFAIISSFKKPVELDDWIGDVATIDNLFAFNSSDGNKNALFDVTFHKTLTVDMPGITDMDGVRLEVVIVDGLYGVKRDIPRSDGKEYVIEPKYEQITIYGTNPGNTYMKVNAGNNYYHIYDKFGWAIVQGNEITPVFVQGSEEVACFIAKYWDTYAIYECPKIYTPKKTCEVCFSPRIEHRIWDCTSIDLVEDGIYKCVKQDGSIEYVTIDKLKK